jgi:hypothetical protein
MALSNWQPPDTSKPPSNTNMGNVEQRPLYEAVGLALSEWEYTEMAMAWLFAALIESRSDAGARAYGTIGGPNGRRDAINFAGEEFFRSRNSDDQQTKTDNADVTALMKAYETATEFRNKIAHGIVTQRVNGFGFFLHAPQYASKRLDKQARISSTYFYTARHIRAFASRFSEIRREAERLAYLLRERYGE